MYEYGVTRPKQVHIHLIKKGFGEQNKNHLNSFLTQLRTEKYGESNIDMNSLKTWLVENSEVPSNNTQPFIVDFEISKRDENLILDLRFHRCNYCNWLSMSTISDGTYKLIWQNFPVLQCGTTDMHRQFHPFGLSVCTSETGDDYAFIFNAIKKVSKAYMASIWNQQF